MLKLLYFLSKGGRVCLQVPYGPWDAGHRPQNWSRLLRARSSTAEASEQEAAERHDISDSRSSGQQKDGSKVGEKSQGDRARITWVRAAASA